VIEDPPSQVGTCHSRTIESVPIWLVWGHLGGSGRSETWTLIRAKSVPSSFSAVMVNGPLSSFEQSVMVRRACLSSVLTVKWAPVSTISPSFFHVILGLGLPVNGIFMTAFSPLSKKAESLNLGGMFSLGGCLILSSALEDFEPPVLEARQV